MTEGMKPQLAEDMGGNGYLDDNGALDERDLAAANVQEALDDDAEEERAHHEAATE